MRGHGRGLVVIVWESAGDWRCVVCGARPSGDELMERVVTGHSGVKAIGFWQALGILVLSRILFGGLGFRPGMFGAHRRMHERWMK
jgi:hypothetical protein